MGIFTSGGGLHFGTPHVQFLPSDCNGVHFSDKESATQDTKVCKEGPLRPAGVVVCSLTNPATVLHPPPQAPRPRHACRHLPIWHPTVPDLHLSLPSRWQEVAPVADPYLPPPCPTATPPTAATAAKASARLATMPTVTGGGITASTKGEAPPLVVGVLPSTSPAEGLGLEQQDATGLPRHLQRRGTASTFVQGRTHG